MSDTPRFPMFTRVVITASGKIGTVLSYACTPARGFLYAVRLGGGVGRVGTGVQHFKESQLTQHDHDPTKNS